MRSVTCLALSFMFAVGVLSGCSGSDGAPIIAPSPAPTAVNRQGPQSAIGDDQRETQSDDLTSEEVALVSQADSDPDPAPKQDL
ncbi:MAG TPA: hypothetical protein VN666_13830 [Nitrospira sp.]|nr:hypothetical protein [Nitrospira sp.]